MAQTIKDPSVKPGDEGDVGSITGSGRSPGVGNGNPWPWNGCSADRRAWGLQTGVTKSQTGLNTMQEHFRRLVPPFDQEKREASHAW